MKWKNNAERSGAAWDKGALAWSPGNPVGPVEQSEVYWTRWCLGFSLFQSFMTVMFSQQLVMQDWSQDKDWFRRYLKGTAPKVIIKVLELNKLAKREKNKEKTWRNVCIDEFGILKRMETAMGTWLLGVGRKPGKWAVLETKRRLSIKMDHKASSNAIREVMRHEKAQLDLEIRRYLVTFKRLNSIVVRMETEYRK